MRIILTPVIYQSGVELAFKPVDVSGLTVPQLEEVCRKQKSYVKSRFQEEVGFKLERKEIKK